MKKPTRLTKLTRVFTPADIEAFFNEHWGKQSDPSGPSYAIRAIELVPVLQPPTWYIKYVAVYPERVNYHTLVVIQSTHYSGWPPVLDIALGEELPEGLASPQAEDAAIEACRT